MPALLDRAAAVLYVQAMADRGKNRDKDAAADSRQERLKAALKANIARRKAQARKRAATKADRTEQ